METATYHYGNRVYDEKLRSTVAKDLFNYTQGNLTYLYFNMQDAAVIADKHGVSVSSAIKWYKIRWVGLYKEKQERIRREEEMLATISTRRLLRAIEARVKREWEIREEGERV